MGCELHDSFHVATVSIPVFGRQTNTLMSERTGKCWGDKPIGGLAIGGPFLGPDAVCDLLSETWTAPSMRLSFFVLTCWRFG
jgi:hypothetical protein